MNRSAPPGFTLLELLVALVVLGFVLAGIAQGVQFGLRVWNMQSQDIGAHADVDAADRVLRHLVAQMDPGTTAAAPEITGGASRLAFTTDLGEAAAALGVRDANVALLVQNHNLLLRWTPAVHGVRLDPVPPPVNTVLLPGVEGVEFAYWAHGEGGAGSWQTAWTEKDLPPFVKIRLIFPAAAHRRWPDIIAPTMRLRPNG
jgi:general secretion pathway protein J